VIDQDDDTDVEDLRGELAGTKRELERFRALSERLEKRCGALTSIAYVQGDDLECWEERTLYLLRKPMTLADQALIEDVLGELDDRIRKEPVRAVSSHRRQLRDRITEASK
jgi:hypothetical protein